MNRTLFFLLSLFLAGSCGTRPEGASPVYFAGEIINPTSDYVVLYKDDIKIDSALLDDNNRFSFTLNTLNPGLHHFKHAPEFQYVYLEPEDSLMIRLNTRDFDESLVFSGRGQEVNNFLLEMFLTNEDEEAMIGTYYGLDPEAFSSKIDSLRENKNALLQQILTEADFSENAMEIAQASIDYTYFIYKEMYPFYYKKRMGLKEIPSLKNGFYDYRASLNLNNKNLTYFRPYYKYINYHLGNLTYMQCLEDCEMHDQTLESYLHFNKHKLGLIDSLITEKELRDNVFRHVAIDYLLKVQDDQKNNEEFINAFRRLSGNNRHISEINNLYEGIRNLQPEKPLPNVDVEALDGKVTTLREIAKDRKAVFYFWSGTQKGHFDNITSRIQKLTEEHKDLTFVGVNLNTEKSLWKALIASKGLDTALQYRSENYEGLHNSLILYPMNKVIITRDSLIVDAFANLYTSF